MIFAIKPFEIHDGDGIRTTVFFKGCPLRCKWCHNPESQLFEREILFDSELCKHCMACTGLCEANIIQNGKHLFLRESYTFCKKCEDICPSDCFEVTGQSMSAEEIASQVLKDEIFMRGSGGGVTFSGGEPLMQVDLCVEIAKFLKARDINLAIDTCGAVPKSSIDQILPFTDTFLFDIKAIDEAVHLSCTGVSNKQILENIRYVDFLGVPIEIRYPYVPSMNSGEAEKIAYFIKELKNVKRVRVLAYHNYAERKYECLGRPYPIPNIPIPSKKEIELVAKKMQNCGLKNVVPA
ncbi:MAG: glycyl-radical enzyme activating protein [Clostridia bacterium]|nr:glycyl-radical enzyme activating protein [Clostridia bacterium]